jgi:hypothetical protein
VFSHLKLSYELFYENFLSLLKESHNKYCQKSWQFLLANDLLPQELPFKAIELSLGSQFDKMKVAMEEFIRKPGFNEEPYISYNSFLKEVVKNLIFCLVEKCIDNLMSFLDPVAERRNMRPIYLGRPAII